MSNKETYRNYIFPLFDIFIEKTDGLIPSVFCFEIFEQDFEETFSLISNYSLEEILSLNSSLKTEYYIDKTYGDGCSDELISLNARSYRKADTTYYFSNELKVLFAIKNRFLNSKEFYLEVFYSKKSANISLIEDLFLKLREISQRKQIKEKTPKINLLVNTQFGLDTMEFDLDIKDLDLNKNYNDDILLVHYKVKDFLSSNNSGLVLFHGPPGTGKSTYLKYLSLFSENKVIFIPSNLIVNLSDPSFINLLAYKKGSVLILEDAEKALESRENNHNSAIVSTILNLTDGILGSALKIKIFATFNCDIDNIDKALTRKGRLVCEYEFKKLTKEKSDNLLESLGSEKSGVELSIAEIYSREQNVFSKKEKEKQKVIGFAT